MFFFYQYIFSRATNLFPTFLQSQLVAIVDPHIKRDPGLYIYTEAQQLDILTKMPDGTTDFEGWCWTGSSAWTDWFNPKSWDWWIGAFAFEKFKVRSSSNPLFRFRG